MSVSVIEDFICSVGVGEWVNGILNAAEQVLLPLAFYHRGDLVMACDGYFKSTKIPLLPANTMMTIGVVGILHLVALCDNFVPASRATWILS